MMKWLRGIFNSNAIDSETFVIEPEPEKEIEELDMVSWQRISNTDYLIALSNGLIYRGWDYWWYSYPKGEYNTFKINNVLRASFRRIEWGDENDKESKDLLVVK